MRERNERNTWNLICKIGLSGLAFSESEYPANKNKPAEKLYHYLLQFAMIHMYFSIRFMYVFANVPSSFSRSLLHSVSGYFIFTLKIAMQRQHLNIFEHWCLKRGAAKSCENTCYAYIINHSRIPIIIHKHIFFVLVVGLCVLVP